MWETCTMGGSPYPGIPLENLLQRFREGHRMEKPACCPQELYNIMDLCWQQDPDKRPSFQVLETHIETVIRGNVRVSVNTIGISSFPYLIYNYFPYTRLYELSQLI